MKIVEAELCDFEHKGRANVKRPGPEHFDTVIREPCMVTVDGQSEVVYAHAKPEDADLLWALKRIEYVKGRRSSGMWSTTRTFGYAPRIVTRRDFCSRCVLHRDQPEEGAVLDRFSKRAEGHLLDYQPRIYDAMREQTADVHDRWKMQGTVFTSGIANKNNALAYHRDQSNFTGSWNVMFAFQRGCGGGLLVMPSLRIAFDFEDQPGIISFDGMRIYHGVTDCALERKDSYRYTAVYYALTGFLKCGTYDEELERIRRVKTEREQARLLDREKLFARLKPK